MTEKLKTCPFCGGTAKIAKGEIEFWVYCPHCGAQTELYETEKEAVEKWNSRLIEDALKEENKRLQKELAEAIEQNQINVYKVAAQAARGANYALKEVKKLEAENERLREALNKIKKTVEDAQDTIYPFHIALDSKDAVYILEVTKEALKGDKE